MTSGDRSHLRSQLQCDNPLPPSNFFPLGQVRAALGASEKAVLAMGIMNWNGSGMAAMFECVAWHGLDIRLVVPFVFLGVSFCLPFVVRAIHHLLPSFELRPPICPVVPLGDRR